MFHNVLLARRMFCHNYTHPTRGYVAPLSVNFWPETPTKPVVAGGAGAVVVLLPEVVVVEGTVVVVEGAVVVGTLVPGKHWE